MKTKYKIRRYRYLLALIVVATSVMFPQLKAQSASGLYMFGQDLHEGRLSYDTRGKAGCSIKLRHLAYSLPIKVTCGNWVRYLHKDSVYGYRDHKGIDHRFFNHNDYSFLSSDPAIALYIVLETGKTKYEEASYSYYFSRGLNSPVLPLTLHNLVETYSDNKNFIELLESQFKNKTSLPEFDEAHKVYKLSHLLKLSKDQP